MAKADPGKLAERALVKLGEGLVGKIPVAGVVLKAIVGTALERIFGGRPSDAEQEAKLARFDAELAVRSVDTIKDAILEFADMVPEARTPIQELAEAVADPEGLSKQGRLREAMVKLFSRVGKQTDDLEELAKAIPTHITAVGNGATAVGSQTVQGGTAITGGLHFHYGDRRQAPAKPEADAPSSPRVSIGRLPVTGEHLFGREGLLGLLDEAWADETTQLVSLVAAGGVGKSALVNHWLSKLSETDYGRARRVYGHSFYSQGTSDETASADTFIAEALGWFGDPEPEKGSPWAKGERLAALVKAEPTLLILDGMEPLQHPPGPVAGRITDPSLQALVRELAGQNPGLCVITTRQHVADLDRFTKPTVRQVDLESLPKGAGAALLKALGVKGPQEELEDASEECGNHALALTLLGTYLVKALGGDVGKRGEVSLLTADEVAAGGHAKRVMAWYEKWLGKGPELSILRMLGLFNRPAEAGCIAALRDGKIVRGLTDGLTKISEANWNIALSNLREAGLLAKPDPANPGTLDAHPLVREHFGEELKDKHPKAWREGHKRLYEYLKGPGCKKELPETLEEMAPLFAAMTHGCAAGRQQEAFDEVYRGRITRRNEFFSTKKLGAFGADLAALAGLFDEPWHRPVTSLGEADQAFLLHQGGFRLWALGRLADALDPMLAGLKKRIAQENFKSASIVAGNISELLLTLGRIEEAVEYGNKTVGFADRSRDEFLRMVMRTALADALHQIGRVSDAATLFREAERMQKDHQPEYPLLYSRQGHQYCDLLLGRGDHQGVIERATQTLAWAAKQGVLLDIGLDHLSLGRARLCEAQAEEAEESTQAREHLDLAVDGLRAAGRQDSLPYGFLARAELYIFTGDYDDARADLNEALDIATRDPQGHMKLHVTDCHLGYARLALAQDDAGTARKELDEARKLIDETGYRRRDPELLIATARLNLLDGDRDAARQTLAQAKAKVEEMGYHSLDHELAELEEKLA